MKKKIMSVDDLLKEIVQCEPVELSEIPSIDLYMDQVTTFMEDRLGSFKRSSDDKVLTKTMINNYAKAHVFPSPIKKKYSRNHMMLLIIIYHLKSILSINDISKLLSPITKELSVNEKSQSLETVYNIFVSLQRHSDDNILSELTGKHFSFDAEGVRNIDDLADDVKLILTVLMLCINANSKKRLAEKLIDDYL